MYGYNIKIKLTCFFFFCLGTYQQCSKWLWCIDFFYLHYHENIFCGTGWNSFTMQFQWVPTIYVLVYVFICREIKQVFVQTLFLSIAMQWTLLSLFHVYKITIHVYIIKQPCKADLSLQCLSVLNFVFLLIRMNEWMNEWIVELVVVFSRKDILSSMNFQFFLLLWPLKLNQGHQNLTSSL